MLKKPVASAARPMRSVGMPNHTTNTVRPSVKAAYAVSRHRRQYASRTASSTGSLPASPAAAAVSRAVTVRTLAFAA